MPHDDTRVILNRLNQQERAIRILALLAIPSGAFLPAWVIYHALRISEVAARTAWELSVTAFLVIAGLIFWRLSKIDAL